MSRIRENTKKYGGTRNFFAVPLDIFGDTVYNIYTDVESVKTMQTRNAEKEKIWI